MYSGLTMLYALCFLLYSLSGEVCDSIEEGDIWNFICGVQHFTKSVDFQMLSGDKFETVTSCDPQGTCQAFNSSYNSTLVKMENKITYHCRLEIKKAKRDENNFRCLIDEIATIRTCEFDIYVKPQKPTCTAPVLSSSGQHLLVKCKTNQVYPEARCVFSSEALPASFNVPVTYSKRQSRIRSSDISTECNGRIPVKYLPIGHHQFRVTMYADVKDGKEKTSVKSDLTDSFELSLPSVVIASNCPVGQGVKEGFIGKGTTATCKCELSYEGSPPGNAQWYNSDGVAVGTRNHDGSSTLRLAYDATNPKPSYECHAESLLRETQKWVTFYPLFVDAEENNDACDDAGVLVAVLAFGMGAFGIALVIVTIVAVHQEKCFSKLYRTMRARAWGNPTYPEGSSSPSPPQNGVSGQHTDTYLSIDAASGGSANNAYDSINEQQ